MPRKYVRKVGARPRAEWTQEALIAAIDEIKKGILGINEISRKYGIPSRTLRRRFANKNTEKQTLGNHPVLDFVNEKRLVSHIQKLEKTGFPPTGDMIRRLAFEFAEKLGKETKFNKETRRAGPQWLKSFLERNTELSIRQAEGLPVARANGLNRDDVNEMYFFLLNHIKEDYMDETPNVLDETQDPLDESCSRNLQSVVNGEDSGSFSTHTNNTPINSPTREETVKIELSPEPTPSALIDTPNTEDRNRRKTRMESVPEVDEIEENGEGRTIRNWQKLPSTYDCNCNKVTVECDAEDLFFLGYANTYKRLSRRKQVTVKFEIAKAFMEAELGDIQENK